MSQIEPTLHDTWMTPVNSGNGLPDRTGSLVIGSRGEPVHAKGTAIIISTRGRPDIVNELVTQIAEQSKPPEHIFVIASKPEDISGLNLNRDHLTVQVGRTGLTLQRNDGLTLAGSRFSYIVFFDDDFVPSRFWLERMEDIFASRPDIAGLTGTVLADGTTTAGIRLDDARAMVRRRDSNSTTSGVLHEDFAFGSNMGCNMAFRYSELRNVRFDERLPLYAWLEDHDFRGQIERHGRVVRADDLWGVHLGHKPGRVRGVTLGYSQIANVVYLAKKGTVPKPYLAKLVSKNLLINAVRSFRPEPFVDRRGRLLGNMIALADIVRGRIAPERILELDANRNAKVVSGAKPIPEPLLQQDSVEISR
jgi:glycosyltransferase involved in cell wall biosynthesis